MQFDPSTYQTPAGYRPKQSTGLIDGRPAVEVLDEMRAAQGQAPMLERIPTPPATAPASPSIDPSAYAPASPYGSPQPDRIQRYNAIKQYQNTMADKFGDMLTPELYVELGKKAEQEYEMLYPEKYATQIQDIPGTASVLVLTPDGKSQIVAKEQRGIDVPLERLKMDVAEKQAAAKETQQKKVSELASGYRDLGETINLVDEIANHPGLPDAVGFQIGQSLIPGTAAADFDSRLERLKAGNFMEGVRKLKAAGGAGALSDAEGKKLDSAMAALNRYQSEESFRKELQRIREVFNASRERAAAELKTMGMEPTKEESPTPAGTTSQSQKPVKRIWNAVTGKFEDAQ